MDMETGVNGGGADTANRCPSPAQPSSALCLTLLRSACRGVAAADTSPRHLPSVVDTVVITDGPRRTRTLPMAAEPAVDADAFFEYDVDSGPAASASCEGADTGCALTSPVDGSQGSPSPPLPGQPAPPPEPPGSPGQPGHGYQNPLVGIPIPGGGREPPSELVQRPQQSPSEKVDAWLRACHDEEPDSTDSPLEETSETDEATECPSVEDQQPEDGQDSEDDMEDALTDADDLDIRELLSRGCRMLHIDAERSAEEEESAGDDSTPRPDSLALPELEESPPPAQQGVTEAGEEEEEVSTSGGSSELLTPDQLKRSASLKSGKTPPVTPGRKKFVRFADALGLDLQQVRTFRDEIPHVPAAAFRGLNAPDDLPPLPGSAGPATYQMSFGSSAGGFGAGSAPADLAAGRQLIPMFLQPGGSMNFLDRLRAQKVLLENVVCQDEDCSVRGVVRVLNIDYHKSVRVRYTLDEWRTWSEVLAEYVAGSCDGLSDRFQFKLYASTLSAGQRLQFALAFCTQGQEFWDSNAGQNYVIQCAQTGRSPPDEWSGGRL